MKSPPGEGPSVNLLSKRRTFIAFTIKRKRWQNQEKEKHEVIASPHDKSVGSIHSKNILFVCEDAIFWFQVTSSAFF